MNKLPLVLVLEDNTDNLDLLSYQLEILNLDCICAQEGVEGLYLAKTHEPDVILLDIILPDMDGEEVISCLKQNPKTTTIPIIALTAMAMVKDKQRILKAGADDYITKPYDLEILDVTIRRYLKVKSATLPWE
ncbi:MAG: response regulator [Nostocaceae cyanobacterium]|nr:response regulator [Nostocaceae cyanobacterium]